MTRTFIQLLVAVQIFLAGTSAASAQPAEPLPPASDALPPASDAPPPASDAPPPASDAPPPAHPPRGFLDFNYLYDTRDLNVFNLNVLANLPHGFQYFAMMNFFGKTDSDRNAQVESFYTEQNLRWTFLEGVPLALTTQWQIASGHKNDSLRFGLLWSISKTKGLKSVFDALNLSLSANVHPFQIDDQEGYKWQIEYVYKWKILPEILDNRIYLNGFADQNMDGNKLVWVTEHQVGLRVVYGLHLVSRLRHNGNFPMDQTGVGFGLQYMVEL